MISRSLVDCPSAVAWFISYWQGKKANTSGQKLAISIGLCLSSLGFGKDVRTCSHTIDIDDAQG